jgi:hypothetical protein
MIVSPILSSIPMVTQSRTARVDLQPAQPSPSLTASSPEVEAVPQSEPRGVGVLNKLLSGHFRGVSELRLRINFNDELTAAQNEMAREATTEATGALLQAVAAEFDAAADSISLTEIQLTKMGELRSLFDQGAEKLIESHLASGTGDGSGLVAEIEATFENMVANLEQFAAASTQTENPVEPTLTAVEDVTSEPLGPEFQAFLSALRETFSANLAELSAVLEPKPWQPAQSAPRGNGRAYEKFLAAYDVLQAPVGDPSVNGGGRNVTVNIEAIDILA